jgi:hypothetical protein
MGEGSYALIEMTLTFGVLIAFLIYELRSVRRAMRSPPKNPEPPRRDGPASKE